MTDADYHGVHTADEFEIAAAYATATAELCACGYPVIVELDVSGLTPHPDVDAMIAAEYYIMQRDARRTAKERAGEFDNIGDIVDAYSNDEVESTAVESGESWQRAVFASNEHHNIAQAFVDAFGLDEKAYEEFNKYSQGGEINPLVLAALTTQRRWMSDFGADRVQRAYTIKPIWPEIFEDYWNDDDAALEEKADKIIAAGYELVTLDDVYNQVNFITKKKLYERPGVGTGSREFHGTASSYFLKAFPDIKIPEESPFKVDQIDEDDDE